MLQYILKIVLELFARSLRHLTFSNIRMYENAQFAINYCFLILRNVYSSKNCVESAINLISLKNHDGMCSGNLRKVSEYLRDYFQPTVFNLQVARMTCHAKKVIFMLLY